MIEEGRYLGVDVGGTKVATALLDVEREAVDVFDPVPTCLDDADALLDQLAGIIGRHVAEGATAVGIGLPSVIEFSTGRVLHSVNLPLHDVELRRLLSDRAGVPVYVDNDASCAALAEAHNGARLVAGNLVMFTVGTGVGGGLVLGGRLYRGSTSAAELGHTIIGLDLAHGAPDAPGEFPQPGSLERLASGRALDRLAASAAAEHPYCYLGRAVAAGEEVTGSHAVDGAMAGDEWCIAVVRILGERLGIGVANAINTFDPDEVVIGGGVSRAGDLLLAPVERVARRHTVPGAGRATVIRLAKHGPLAGVVGAATMAAQEHGLESAKLSA